MIGAFVARENFSEISTLLTSMKIRRSVNSSFFRLTQGKSSASRLTHGKLGFLSVRRALGWGGFSIARRYSGTSKGRIYRSRKATSFCLNPASKRSSPMARQKTLKSEYDASEPVFV